MEEKKIIKYDLDGYDVVTRAIMDLINRFPGLKDGEEIAFSTLGENSGKAIFPVSGSVIETERKTVTGQVTELQLLKLLLLIMALVQLI